MTDRQKDWAVQPKKIDNDQFMVGWRIYIRFVEISFYANVFVYQSNIFYVLLLLPTFQLFKNKKQTKKIMLKQVKICISTQIQSDFCDSLYKEKALQ